MSVTAAWGLVRIFGPIVLAGLLFTLWLSSSRQVATQRREVARVANERDELIAIVTEATVAPDAKGRRVPLSTKDALAAARGIIRDRDSKRAALVTVDRVTKANVATDVAARQTRVFTQAANETARKRVAPVVARLERVAPTGDAQGDAVALDTASKAAWETGK